MTLTSGNEKKDDHGTERDRTGQESKPLSVPSVPCLRDRRTGQKAKAVLAVPAGCYTTLPVLRNGNWYHIPMVTIKADRNRL